MLSTLFWQRGFLLKVRFLDWALSGKELHMRLEGFASSAVLGKWPGWLHGVDHCVAFVAAVCSLPVKRFWSVVLVGPGNLPAMASLHSCDPRKSKQGRSSS